MKLVLIDEIAEVFNGKTPSKAEQREIGFPVLKIKDVDEDGNFRGRYSSFVDNELIVKLDKKILKESDILVLNAAHNSDYVASKNCIVTNEFSGSLATGEWMIIRSKEKVLAGYLFFYINSSFGRLSIKNIVKGIHLYPNDFKKIQIPLPSLSEQTKIVKIFDQANSLRKKRKQSISLLGKHLDSLFFEMFGDPVRNERAWNVKSLANVAKLERGRFSPRPRNDPSYFNGSYPFIQTGDISNSDHRLKKFKQTLNDKGIKVSKQFYKGDIVIAIVGATIGVTAILEIDVYATDSVICIKPNNSINSIFLEYVLRYWRIPLLKNAPEVARPNINLEILNRVGIICPPMELQTKFAQIVEKIEVLKQKMLLQSKELDLQFQALTQKSFQA